MATTAAKPEVFSRKASGLSRVMSPWSAFMYNFLTMGVIFPWTFVWAPEAFPGVSVWKACLFATLLELPIALAYVWMATAMPRSGGDYVFQSRVLGGAIGFPVVMSGFVMWILQWVALAGWLLAVLGVAPLFLGLGVNYNSKGLINAGMWASAAGVVTISIIGAAAMAILLVTGFKNYVRLQYFMFAATGILVVIMLVQFLRTSPAHFAVAINHFNGVVDKNPAYYTWLQHDVSATGFNMNPKFALGATLLAAPIAWTSTQWATYSVEQGGEIKGARVFKNQMFIIVGSLIAMGCRPGPHRLGREARRRHRLLQCRVGLLLLRGERLGQRDRQHAALPGHVRHRDLPQLVHHDPRGSELHARVAADPLQLLHRHDPRHGRHVARPYPAGLVLQGQLALPHAVERPPHLLPPGRVAIWGYSYVAKWSTITLGVTFACGYVFVVSALAAALLPTGPRRSMRPPRAPSTSSPGYRW